MRRWWTETWSRHPPGRRIRPGWRSSSRCSARGWCTRRRWGQRTRGVHRIGMAAPIYYTAEQVRAFPEDGNRYEVVHGELLVTPAPRDWHQEISGRLFESLRAYQPDVFVVPLEQARTLDWTRM